MARKSNIALIHDTYFDAQEGYQYRAVCPSLGKEYEPISVRPDKARKKAREWMKKYETRTILQRRKIQWTKRRKMHGCYQNHIIKVLSEWKNYRIYTPQKPKGVWANPQSEEKEMKDFVKCTNCGIIQLIETRTDKCPKCGKESLMWIDERLEFQEVKSEFNIQKYLKEEFDNENCNLTKKYTEREKNSTKWRWRE